jgi:hypothetical protein
MSRKCTICSHHQRSEIETAMIASASLQSIAERFGISKAATFRHQQEHLPQKLLKAEEAREVAGAEILLRQVKAIQGTAARICRNAEEKGELDTALRACREMRGCVELLAKLTGELDERPIMNVTLSPQWVEIRAIIVESLKPFPEARHSVAKALENLPQ